MTHSNCNVSAKFPCWLLELFLLYYLQIVFDDQNKDGQMVVNLFSSLNEFKCSGKFSNFCKDYNFFTVFSLIVMCQYCSINSGVNLSFVLQQMKMTTKWSRCCLTFLWSLSACSPRSCVSAPCTELTISGWLVFSSKGLWYISFLLVQFTKHIEVLLLANQGIYFATFFLAHLIWVPVSFSDVLLCVTVSQYIGSQCLNI